MKIGILQTGHSPEEMIAEHGNYGERFTALLAGHGFAFEVFSVVDGVFPDGPGDADGWLITGSKHGAYEDHDWIAPLEDLIRDIARTRKPLVGVCFGHQIIAQAMGGRVVKFPGGWAVGRTEYLLGGERYMLNAWHQDQVVELPEGARVLGASAHCEYAVLGYGDHIWTVQPHPEFDSAFVKGLIAHRGRGNVPEPLIAGAEEGLERPNDNGRIAAQIAEFFKRKAHAA